MVYCCGFFRIFYSREWPGGCFQRRRQHCYGWVSRHHAFQVRWTIGDDRCVWPQGIFSSGSCMAPFVPFRHDGLWRVFRVLFSFSFLWTTCAHCCSRQFKNCPKTLLALFVHKYFRSSLFIFVDVGSCFSVTDEKECWRNSLFKNYSDGRRCSKRVPTPACSNPSRAITVTFRIIPLDKLWPCLIPHIWDK